MDEREENFGRVKIRVNSLGYVERLKSYRMVDECGGWIIIEIKVIKLV